MAYAFLEWFRNVKHCILLFHSPSNGALRAIAPGGVVVHVLPLLLSSSYTHSKQMSHDLLPLKEVTAIYTFSCSYLCLFGVKMLSPDGSGSSH